MLAFSRWMCYYIKVVRKTHINPGVAKFGIALEWGSRGLEFESQHSDQNLYLERGTGFFFLLKLFLSTEYDMILLQREVVLIPRKME